MSAVENFRENLLGWYDTHRRALPWRALPGAIPDPYHVWLSEIMLQQTTVAAVIPYYTKFLDLWPCVEDLAAAKQEEIMHEWAGLGYYARARNLHQCAQMIAADYEGRFPSAQSELRKLSGIGDYTSAAIAAIAFNKEAIVVDGNIERIMARYFAVQDSLPGVKTYLKSLAAPFYEGCRRPGDLAQGLMDLGAGICRPQSPDCGICPLQKECLGYKENLAEELPRRMRQKNRPQKFGYVYWVLNKKGKILTQRRPQKGMLGGMVGLPSSAWESKKKDLQHPVFLEKTSVEPLKAHIRHSFTHFDLRLDIMQVRDFDYGGALQDYSWISFKELNNLGFPTLFKKVLKFPPS